jgi:hypothetical protein
VFLEKLRLLGAKVLELPEENALDSTEVLLFPEWSVAKPL